MYVNYVYKDYIYIYIYKSNGKTSNFYVSTSFDKFFS